MKAISVPRTGVDAADRAERGLGPLATLGSPIYPRHPYRPKARRGHRERCLNQRVGQPDDPTAPVRAPEADRLRCLLETRGWFFKTDRLASGGCSSRPKVTRFSEMAARGTDRQRRPSMNYRPATSGGADRSMWRSASSSAWRTDAARRGLLDDARNLADPELLQVRHSFVGVRQRLDRGVRLGTVRLTDTLVEASLPVPPSRLGQVGWRG